MTLIKQKTYPTTNLSPFTCFKFYAKLSKVVIRDLKYYIKTTFNVIRYSVNIYLSPIPTK